MQINIYIYLFAYFYVQINIYIYLESLSLLSNCAGIPEISEREACNLKFWGKGGELKERMMILQKIYISVSIA